MITYKGFSAIITEENGEYTGKVVGIDVQFTANSEQEAEEKFHQIVDEHLPTDD